MAQRTSPGTDIALTIAGSDSCGGSGIQADLKTFSVLGVYGASAITTVMAQNTRGLQLAESVSSLLIERQIDAVANDLDIRATKTGFMGHVDNVLATAQAVGRNKLAPLVVDPVICSKSGNMLVDDDAVAAIKEHLFPLATLVTLNRHEAARLAGVPSPIDDLSTASQIATNLCKQYGMRACVIQGFRVDDAHGCHAVDLYFDGNQSHEITSEWRLTENTFGSGATFSAAITGALALGQELTQAIETAKSLVSEAIRQSTNIGLGHSPVNALSYMTLKK